MTLWAIFKTHVTLNIILFVSTVTLIVVVLWFLYIFNDFLLKDWYFQTRSQFFYDIHLLFKLSDEQIQLYTSFLINVSSLKQINCHRNASFLWKIYFWLGWKFCGENIRSIPVWYSQARSTNSVLPKYQTFSKFYMSLWSVPILEYIRETIKAS